MNSTCNERGKRQGEADHLHRNQISLIKEVFRLHDVDSPIFQPPTSRTELHGSQTTIDELRQPTS